MFMCFSTIYNKTIIILQLIVTIDMPTPQFPIVAQTNLRCVNEIAYYNLPFTVTCSADVQLGNARARRQTQTVTIRTRLQHV